MHRSSFLRQLEVLNESLAAQLTDGELLERFAWRRDETAFAVVVHRHGGLVLGVCRRILRNAQDAEDAYQATFLVLARKAYAFRWQKSIANWLYGVARRTAMKSRERAARRQRVEKVAPMMPEPAARSQSSLQEICALLDDELSRLAARYRQPLLLCYMESRTRDQAAAQLGWSRRTLYRRLERGLEVLRLRLERRGVSLGGAMLATALAQQAADASVPVVAVSGMVKAILAASTGPAVATGLAPPVTRLASDIAEGMLMAKLRWGIALGLIVSSLLVGAVTLMPRNALTESAADQSHQSLKPVADLETPLPPVSDSPPTDLYGDPLPAGAVARLGSSRYRFHTEIEWATPFQFAPDGLTVAVLSGSAIRLLETATGREQRRFEGNYRQPNALAFSSNGRLLAVGVKGNIVLWDTATGMEVCRIPLAEDFAELLRFTAAGETLIGTQGPQGRTTRAWDLASGTELWHSDNQTSTLGLDNYGRVVTREPRTVSCRDPRTGQVSHQWSIAFGGGSWPCLSPDGGTLVAVRHEEREVCLAAWDTGLGEQLWQAEVEPLGAYPLAFAHHSPIIAVREPHAIGIWDARGGQKIRQVPFGDRTDEVRFGAFSPDDRIFACIGRNDKALRLLDLETGRELNADTRSGSPIRSASFEPGGHTIATGHEDSTVIVWDRSTGRATRRFSGGTGAVTALAIGPGGKLLAEATEADAAVRLWNPASGRRHGSVLPWSSPVAALAFAPDGQRLAVGTGIFRNSTGNGAIGIWNVATDQEPVRCNGSNRAVRQLFFSADGQTLLSVHANALDFWDSNSGNRLREAPLRAKLSAFGPQGKGGVALTAGGTISRFGPDLFDSAEPGITTDCPKIQGSRPNGIGNLAVSPDGHVLAAVPAERNTTVQLWDLATGRMLAHFTGHDGPITVLTFAPDGDTLASGSADTTMLLWDVAALVRKHRSPEPE